jgi:hypothetical protein
MIVDEDIDQWSAPSWMAADDLVFFYLSKRALPRILRALYGAILLAVPEHEAVMARYGPDDPRFYAWLHEATAALRPGDDKLVDLLARERDLARELQGTIFAGARVIQSASVAERGDADDRAAERLHHWRGCVYAPLADGFCLREPVPSDVFTRHVALSRTGGPTPLHGAAFTGVRDAMAVRNRLPRFVLDAYPTAGLRGVTRETWRERFADDRQAPRFVNEAQFRSYFVDYLLGELRDPGTPLLEECRCTTGGVGPIADYFVRLGGRWLPVETKLNVRTQPDLVAQVARYLGVPTVTPLLRRTTGRARNVDGADVALVLDPEGLYLMNADGYLASGPTRPLIGRTDLARWPSEKVRARVLCHVAQT